MLVPLLLGGSLMAVLFLSKKNQAAVRAPAISTGDAELAAQQLSDYLQLTPVSKRVRSMVASYQGRMGGIKVDGIFGPETKSRMEFLLAAKLRRTEAGG